MKLLPDSSPIQNLPLSGPSMTPTLQPLDLLELEPYGEREVRVGDVVAFPSPGVGKHIVHRVVRVGPEGIRTLGDNNIHEDAVILGPEDLTGRVIAAWRGQRRRIVAGGLRGRLVRRLARMRRWLDRATSFFLRRPYHALARSGALRSILPDPLKPRVVRYGVNEHAQLLLFLGGRVIGNYHADLGGWRIRRPFKILVDEAKLPVLNDNQSE